MNDVVELAIPARADLLVLARLTAATVAARADFGVDEIEDLRLAVDELCLSVIDSSPGGVLNLRYVQDGGEIAVDCTLTSGDPSGHPPVGDTADLSWMIIEALVDEHGRDLVDGLPHAWLRKRGGRVAT